MHLVKSLSLVFVVGLPLAGCSIPFSRADGGPVASHPVDPAARVLVLSVADGQKSGQSPAPGSGQGMVAALGKVMAAHNVGISTTAASDLAIGLDQAQKMGFGYLLKCTITLWEDNATAWSGNGDKLSIYVELYDTKSRELVAAATHKRVATGATFMSGTPDRFLDTAATGALGQIYGWSSKSVNAPNTTTTAKSQLTVNPDVDAMNVQLRRLASDSLANGDPKAAKEYLDMIVPAASQH